jgi:hypothetical protein
LETLAYLTYFVVIWLALRTGRTPEPATASSGRA